VVVSQIESVEKIALGERSDRCRARGWIRSPAGLRFQQASFFER